MFMNWLGMAAAALTSLSYMPQVRKAAPPGSTDDLSLKTLLGPARFSFASQGVLQCELG